jgi:AcrR family transcriptional regulator
MAVRVSRGERKERIRGALVAAARRVFLRRGFHGASLEEISSEAGCTKGAIYSNFAGKDELFLAVLDEQVSRRARVQTARITAAPTFAEGLRAAGRAMAEMASQSPRWTPVLVEFWTHASRRPALRARVAERHERMLEQYGELFTQLAPRFGVEFTVPAREVARSGAAFGRGMALEQLLHPRGVTRASFEDLYATHLLALTKPRSGSSGPHGPGEPA